MKKNSKTKILCAFAAATLCASLSASSGVADAALAGIKDCRDQLGNMAQFLNIPDSRSLNFTSIAAKEATEVVIRHKLTRFRESCLQKAFEGCQQAHDRIRNMPSIKDSQPLHLILAVAMYKIAPTIAAIYDDKNSIIAVAEAVHEYIDKYDRLPGSLYSNVAPNQLGGNLGHYLMVGMVHIHPKYHEDLASLTKAVCNAINDTRLDLFLNKEQMNLLKKSISYNNRHNYDLHKDFYSLLPLLFPKNTTLRESALAAANAAALVCAAASVVSATSAHAEYKSKILDLLNLLAPATTAAADDPTAAPTQNTLAA